MELNEALDKVQSLSNFFKGLKEIEDILQVAKSTQQLAKEREIAAKKVHADLLAAQADFKSFQDTSAITITELRAKVKALQDSYEEKSASLSAKLVEQEAKTTAAIQEARRKQAAAEAEHEAAMSSGHAREAELAKQIQSLEKALNTLKAKAALL